MKELRWAAQELRYTNLGDARRNQRLVKIVEDLAEQPNESIPTACGNWAATKATYNLWKSPRIKPDDIRSSHQISTVERSKEHSIVLAIQDTTDLNFTHHESQCWLSASVATELALPEDIEVVTIADREADIYDLFAMTRQTRSHLLIRGTHNRRVDHQAKYLHASIEQAPVAGFVTITVPRNGRATPEASYPNRSLCYPRYTTTSPSSSKS